MILLLLLFVIAFIAFCVSAVAGGGAGLVLVPLLRLLLPVAQVPAALSIGTATGSLARIHAFRRHIRWDVVRWFAPAALPMAALGAWALSRFEPAYVELIISLFLLANLPALFLRRRVADRQARPLPHAAILLLGAVAGLVSGFTGAVGLLFNRAYLRMGMTKEELVATRAANEIALHILKIALYAAFGLLDSAVLLVGAMVAVAAILAAYVMRWLIPHIAEAPFHFVSTLSMVAAGAAMLFMSSGQIMTIHRAWAQTVRVGEEHEFQLYWGGHRRFVVEREDDGSLAIERRIDPDRLSPPQRATFDRLTRGRRVTLLEEVYGWDGHYYEIYVDGPRGIENIEFH